ncbi:MazG nucleotide pyrophosphohydrolase domain-containing protein [Arthrobacter sp. Helios]|uniref:MazG nucleotide pyrophosphohydrolase domain-containing protein n=1 Tax=Arthrobacter sp. Helios TaxID=2828862 RepID=UPI00204D0769|nr:MazG nucleotide pyrophosphohydrolase domain-containing protein [Arthrobacter sp. Helios]UPO77549.1 nucleotide pyrophosphohydrolase [Arthrobacter sp. Helios]
MASQEPGSDDLGRAFSRLAQVIALLRDRCAWTGALTHESLLEYLLEEAYEVIEAVETGHTGAQDAAELSGELGDVLFQVLLHARLQEEAGNFSILDVVEGLTAKMVRRNPHVFNPDGTPADSTTGDPAEIERAWDAAKRLEKPRRSSAFEGIPASLPALALAAKTQNRARRAGIGVPAAAAGSGAASGDAVPGWDREKELGDLLFETVRQATERGIDPEAALRAAIRRFTAAAPPITD